MSMRSYDRFMKPQALTITPKTKHDEATHNASARGQAYWANRVLPLSLCVPIQPTVNEYLAVVTLSRWMCAAKRKMRLPVKHLPWEAVASADGPLILSQFTVNTGISVASSSNEEGDS